MGSTYTTRPSLVSTDVNCATLGVAVLRHTTTTVRVARTRIPGRTFGIFGGPRDPAATAARDCENEKGSATYSVALPLQLTRSRCRRGEPGSRNDVDYGAAPAEALAYRL